MRTKPKRPSRPAAARDIVIRRATVNDHSEICRLAEQMDSLHRRHLPGRFQKPRGHARRLSYVRYLIGDPSTLLLVAELRGRVVALTNAGMEEMPDMPQKRRGRHVKVRGIVVDSGARRAGIGTALLREVKAWARRHGCREVQFNVYEFNETARRFCESLGCKPLSRRLRLPLC
jgi:GNAT superfamily N-acetyltransferase